MAYYTQLADIRNNDHIAPVDFASTAQNAVVSMRNATAVRR